MLLQLSKGCGHGDIRINIWRLRQPSGLGRHANGEHVAVTCDWFDMGDEGTGLTIINVACHFLKKRPINKSIGGIQSANI